MNKQDVSILSELARRVAEISAEPSQEKLRREFRAHNGMERVPPRVLIFPDGDGAWSEIPEACVMRTSDPMLRDAELWLRRRLYHYEHFHDDAAFEPVYRFDRIGEYTGYAYGDHQQKSAWGLPIRTLLPDAAHGAYRIEPCLNDARDVETLLAHELDFVEDEAATARKQAMLEEAFGGMLRVEPVVPYGVLVVNLLTELIHLRGAGRLLYDLYDEPDMLKRVIGHMAAQKLKLLKRLERDGKLYLNNLDHYTGSGGLGYADELPGAGFRNKVRLKDMWGFADAQEFADVSAAMFKEFILPYQVMSLKEYGLVSYGCCERMDEKLDAVLEIPHIRRVSVSPWSNVDIAAEKIGRKCIYSRKPDPALVSFGFEEEAAEADIRRVLKAAGDCNVEFVLKDIRTCSGNPENLARWVDLAQSLCK